MTEISVVIPTFNRDDLLRRAVKSTLTQSCEPDEIIIVDDNSPIPAEKSLEAPDLDRDKITVHRHNKNKGGNAARQTGIKLATGDYVAFLDDDDEWEETKIEQQIQTIQQTGAGASYTGTKQINNGQIVATKTPDITGDVTTDLLQGNFIGTFSSVMIQRGLVETVGYPDADLPSWHDWDYYLRLSTETEFAAVPEPLVRRHSAGQKQISQDHATKRDVTAPAFLRKHRPLANQYNLGNEFEATVAAEIGWSAAFNDQYRDARHQYFRSFWKQPSREAFLLLCLLIGGRWTFEPVQRFKRMVVSKTN